IEGDSVSLSGAASNSNSSTLHYSAVALPAGLKISATTGVISGSVAPGSAADVPYFVTVTAEDGTYSASATFRWTIASPITISASSEETNSEGDSVSISVSSTDST